MDPPDAYDRIGPMMPVIVAMWHGQHLMVHFASARATAPPASSRARPTASSTQWPCATSASGPSAARERAGARCKRRAGLRPCAHAALAARGRDGRHDRRHPKALPNLRPGHRGAGPALGPTHRPVAVVTSRRIDFASWDRASLGLPFGRGCHVLGIPSRCLETPTTLPSNGRAKRSKAPSTRCTSAPTRLSREGPGARTRPAESLATERARVSPKLPAPILAYRAATSVLEPAAAGLALARATGASKTRFVWRSGRVLISRRAGGPARLAPRRQHRRDSVHAAARGKTHPARHERARHVGHPHLGGAPAAAPAAGRVAPVRPPRRAALRAALSRPLAAESGALAESEIWPNLVLELDARVVPLILVNGRMSDRFLPPLAAPAAGDRAAAAALHLVPRPRAPATATAWRSSARRASRSPATSNLTCPPRPPIPEPWRSSRAFWPAGGLARSQHPFGRGGALRRRASRVGRALSGAPHHLRPRAIPAAGPDVADIAVAAGLATALRSDGAQPAEGRTSTLPTRLARWDCSTGPRRSPSWVARLRGTEARTRRAGEARAAILHGAPHPQLQRAYAALDRAGGARSVADGEALAHTLDRAFGRPGPHPAMARAAARPCRALGGAVERTMRAIDPFISGVKLGARR